MVGVALGLLVVAVGIGALMVSRGYSGSVAEATQLQQQAAVVDSLHTFGNDRAAERVGQANHPLQDGQVIDVVGLFRGKAVDVSAETITIEATGSDEKLQALLEMLSPHGIVELVQSGQVALGRGAKTLTEKSK